MLDQETQREMDETAFWVDRYVASRLAFKRETTRKTYSLILWQFLIWLSRQAGYESSFDSPANLTQTAVQTYLFGELAGTSVSYYERVKSLLSGFAEWLIDEAFLTHVPRFAPRLCTSRTAAGWNLEEVACYLGHTMKKGTPAIQTTARYTQVSQEQIKEKLRSMKG